MATEHTRRRLANFEESDLPDLTRHGDLFSPKPSPQSAAQGGAEEPTEPRGTLTDHDGAESSGESSSSPGTPADRQEGVEDKPKPEARAASDGSAARSRKRRTRSAGTRSPGRPRTNEPAEGSARPTTVTLPTTLQPRFMATAAERGLSNWGLIIEALESADPDALRDEIARAGGRTGGKRFAARTSSRAGARPEEGPPSPINVRPLEEDLVVVDEMKDEVGARSRNQLVQAAVKLLLEA